MTNGVANRVVIAVLSRRSGRRLGRRLAVVEYQGRRSGRQVRLVTLYRTDGQTVQIRVGMAQRKTWWRNFRTAHPVRLAWLAATTTRWRTWCTTATGCTSSPIWIDDAAQADAAPRANIGVSGSGLSGADVRVHVRTATDVPGFSGPNHPGDQRE